MGKIKYTWLFFLSVLIAAAGPAPIFYPAVVVGFICLAKLFV
jgi:hypothetical protein